MYGAACPDPVQPVREDPARRKAVLPPEPGRSPWRYSPTLHAGSSMHDSSLTLFGRLPCVTLYRIGRQSRKRSVERLPHGNDEGMTHPAKRPATMSTMGAESQPRTNGTAEAVYRTHARAIYGFIYVKVGNREAAEDLTSEV